MNGWIREGIVIYTIRSTYNKLNGMCGEDEEVFEKF